MPLKIFHLEKHRSARRWEEATTEHPQLCVKTSGHFFIWWSLTIPSNENTRAFWLTLVKSELATYSHTSCRTAPWCLLFDSDTNRKLWQEASSSRTLSPLSKTLIWTCQNINSNSKGAQTIKRCIYTDYSSIIFIWTAVLDLTEGRFVGERWLVLVANNHNQR